MYDTLAIMTLGAILGALAVVNLFMWAAGAKFSANRQIVVAYAALCFASIFINAVGNANGGPPNFQGAGVQVLGAFLAAIVNIAIVQSRLRAPS